MNVRSKTSKRKTSKASRSTTSLPVSAAGRLRSSSPGGPKIGQSGRGVVRAKATPSPASSKRAKTRAISGLHSFGSSASTALQSSLASKLRTRFGTDGSMIYAMTWKEKTTPSGRTYSQLVASTRTTSVNDSGGWPTPRSNDATGSKIPPARQGGVALKTAVEMAGWPTPMAGSPATENYNEAGNTDSGRKTVALASARPTPRETDGEKNVRTRIGALREIERKGGPQDLCQAAMVAGYTTPQAHDVTPRGQGQKKRHGTKHGCADVNADGQLFSFHAPTANGDVSLLPRKGVLNPRFSLWLMLGPFASAWASCGEAATR